MCLPMGALAATSASNLSLRADTLIVNEGSNLELTLTASQASDLFGIELRVLYDPAVLRLTNQKNDDYTAFPSEASNVDAGILYMSAIAASVESSNAIVAKLSFKALKPSPSTAISIEPIKGVTSERTSRVVEGHVYPDLIEKPLTADAPLHVQVLPRQSSDGSTGSSLPPSSELDNIAQETDPIKAVNALVDLLNRTTIVEPQKRTELSALVQQTAQKILTISSDTGSGQAFRFDEGVIASQLEHYDKLLKTAQALGVMDTAPSAITFVWADPILHDLEFPKATLSALDKSGLDISIQRGTLTMNIPTQTLLVSDSEQTTLTMIPKSQSVRQSDSATLRPLESYEFELRSSSGSNNQANEFVQPIEIYWSYPDGADSDLLGVYLFDEQLNTWGYVPGQQHRKSGAVRVNLPHFSTYALMAFSRHYSDLAQTYSEAVQAIQVLSARHVLNGVSDTEFAPGKSMTRAEWTAMVVRALGWTLPLGASSGFQDVTADKWYSDAVIIAHSRGLVNGYEDETFRPDHPIKRSELAVMLSKLLPASSAGNVDATVFNDHASIPSWAADAVYKAKAQGWLKGDVGNRYIPEGLTTRADAAVVLERMLNSLNE
jgi:hypothetical protein